MIPDQKKLHEEKVLDRRRCNARCGTGTSFTPPTIYLAGSKVPPKETSYK